MSDMPKGDRCPIGSLGLHTYNHECTECIWCGPSGLAWHPGRWVTEPDAYFRAWTAWGPLTQTQMEESTR